MTSRERAIELLEVIDSYCLNISLSASRTQRVAWEKNIALVENAFAYERRAMKRNQIARMLRIIGGRHHTDDHCGCGSCEVLRGVAAAVIRKNGRRNSA